MILKSMTTCISKCASDVISQKNKDRDSATSFPGSLSVSSLVVASVRDDKGGNGERAWERGWRLGRQNPMKANVPKHFLKRKLPLRPIYFSQNTAYIA